MIYFFSITGIHHLGAQQHSNHKGISNAMKGMNDVHYLPWSYLI